MEANFDIATTFVIFGATGDLAQRKLLPSLYSLDRQGLLPSLFKIIAFARKNKTDNEFQAEIQKIIRDNFPVNYSDDSWNKFSRKIVYLQGDFSSEKAYSGLASRLNDVDMQLGVCTHKIFYLAITPDLYHMVLKGIKKTQLEQICKNEKDTRVIMEKPFGKDLENFVELNNLALELFSEDQIYHIDHLVGKETVQNILYFRAANPALLTSYDCRCIESVRINYFEANGIENRGGYYNSFGELRDMVQSHLLQMLALTLMELPEKMTPELISKAKVEVINHLKISDLDHDVIRGQYTKGVIDGKNIKGYLDETNIPASSKTETLVKIRAKMSGGRWDGLPVTLASGKRLSKKVTEVILNYHENEFVYGIKGSNTLIFRIFPDEGIVLKLKVKKPNSNTLENADMVFTYKDNFTSILPEAYEKIILDIIRKSDAYDITSEELEAAWSFVDPLVHKFSRSAGDLLLYPAGSNELVEN